MVNSLRHLDAFDDFNETLFAQIANDLSERGYSINPCALPFTLAEQLWQHLSQMNQEKFEQARIGRDQALMQNNFVRSDAICWITGESPAGQSWLNWSHLLQIYLNRRLFLGLFSFESHFAHYSPGDFYKRHLDAFKGEANRVLTVVVYLNRDWLPEHGGELVLYQDELDQNGIQITPGFATLVVFLSEEFPHEVLVTHRDRYSIAGWYRVNSSIGGKIDPPL